MSRIEKRQIIMLHEELINRIGGEHGLRDDGLLESAINSPFQTFGGEDLYPSVEQQAARLAFALIKNHAFVDGNKRIGILAMLLFLEGNGIIPRYTQEELIDLGLQVADGRMSDRDLYMWVLDRTQ